MDGVIFESEDDFDRTAAAVRYLETLKRNGGQPLPEPTPRGLEVVVVKVIASAPTSVQYWSGLVTHKDFEDSPTTWYEDDEDDADNPRVLVVTLMGELLTQNKRYIGVLIGEHDGYPVVLTTGDGAVAAPIWFPAEITAASLPSGQPPTAPYSWRALDHSGTGSSWFPAGSTYTLNAWPLKIGGASPPVTIGTQVMMMLTASGWYGFIIDQYANYDAVYGGHVPGQVSTGAQTFVGDKTFSKKVVISSNETGELAGDAELIVRNGTYPTTDYEVMHIGGSGVVADFFGGNALSGGCVASGERIYGSIEIGAVVGPGKAVWMNPVGFHCNGDALAGGPGAGLGSAINIYSLFAGVFTIMAHGVGQYVTMGSTGYAIDIVCATLQSGGNYTSAGMVTAGNYVRANTSFWVKVAGVYTEGKTESLTVTYADDSYDTLTWTGGILTNKVFTPAPPPPPPTVLDDILADVAVDGGTW